MEIGFGRLEVTACAVLLRILHWFAAVLEMGVEGQTLTLLNCIKTRVCGVCPEKGYCLPPLLDIKWNPLRLLKCWKC